jgi:hypothetical protein
VVVVLVDVVVVELVLVLLVEVRAAVVVDRAVSGGASPVAVSDAAAQLLSAAASKPTEMAAPARAARPADPLIVPACPSSALRPGR